MPLQKLLQFTKKVSDLADKPNQTMSAAEVKVWFDAAPNEVREHLNKLIDSLQSSADGDSGADNIKATPISTSPNTVQGVLEWLKTQIDSTVLGQIPDGTLTDNKLSNAEGQIKQRFSVHQADDVAHITAAERTYWNDVYTAPDELRRNLDRMDKFRSSKDSEGVYTIVEYKRPSDGSLYARSTLSGSPQYTTKTVVYYDTDSTTVLLTDTYTITYDADGDWTSEVLV